MSELELKDISCSYCDEKLLTRESKLKYICQGCGKDNSLYVVFLWQALEEANPNGTE